MKALTKKEQGIVVRETVVLKWIDILCELEVAAPPRIGKTLLGQRIYAACNVLL